MSLLEILIVAIGLAMDCFAVSVTGGIMLGKFRWSSVLKSAFLFGFFQAAMPVIGWACSNWFSSYIKNFDHWIVFGLLFFIGFKMIYGTLVGESDNEKAFNPQNNKMVWIMAFATSVDALTVGISFAFLYADNIWGILLPSSIIGIVAFLFSVLGFSGGIYFSRIKRFKPEIVGGIMLIGIGLKILIEHFASGI